MGVADFFDRFSVETRGDGRISGWLSEYYGHFLTESVQSTDLIISEMKSPMEPRFQKGGSKDHYGVVDGWLTIKRHGDHVAINEDWTHIVVAPNTNPYFLTNLIEFRLRQRMAEDGYALLHASGAVVDDTTFVFPAWRHTGKTNTMLSLLRETNGGYLSDDRVFVKRDGSVYGYPLPINMFPHNFSAFPDVSPFSNSSERIRYEVSNKIKDRIGEDRLIPDIILDFINRRYIEPDLNKIMRIDELLPSASPVTESAVNELVFLQTAPDGSETTVQRSTLDSDQALADLIAINICEWNSSLREHCSVHETLIDDSNMLAEFEDFVSLERDIMSDLVISQPTSRMSLPQEDDWYEKRVGPKIRGELLDN